jgi:peptidoglycan/LPS O-acetylase OafA/YrhL
MVVIAHSGLYIDSGANGLSASSACRWLRLATEQGGNGVVIFFVISGYCIAAACDGVRRRPKPAGQFFFRRFRRIFPPYWCVLLVYTVLLAALASVGRGGLIFEGANSAVPTPQSLSVWQWLGGISLTETWRYHFGGGPGGPLTLLLRHAWSLCYEEQFYAVCGLALFLSRKWFFGVLALLTLAVAGSSVLQLRCGHIEAVQGFFFDGRWLQFAAGLLLYYRLHSAGGRAQSLTDAAFFFAPLLAAIPYWKHPNAYTSQCLVAWCFVALLRILHRWDVPMAQSRWLRPGCFCGLMCYSLYLTHWPLAKACSHFLYLHGIQGFWLSLLVTFPACLTLCLGVAWAFHILVERRFLNTPAVMAHRLVAADREKQARSAGTAQSSPDVSATLR